MAGTVPEVVLRLRTVGAAVNMDILGFVFPETKEHELRWKEELLLG
jgi:hypothetical protein